MNFARGGGLSGLRCILRKKNGSTTRTRLNHKAHTAQSARLNHTDGSINCLLLLLHIHSCSHWLSSSKRNHGQQSVMNRESSLSILMTMWNPFPTLPTIYKQFSTSHLLTATYLLRRPAKRTAETRREANILLLIRGLSFRPAGTREREEHKQKASKKVVQEQGRREEQAKQHSNRRIAVLQYSS